MEPLSVNKLDNLSSSQRESAEIQFILKEFPSCCKKDEIMIFIFPRRVICSGMERCCGCRVDICIWTVSC